VYARRVNGEVLEFDHRGWLYKDSFLFYDRRTDSLWLQATGESVHGHYKGTRLDRLPATQTTWRQWRQFHPDTLALKRAMGLAIDYWQDFYERYCATGKGMTLDHHGPLSFGLAVITAAEQKLYPYSELEKQPVVADKVAGEPVLVVFHVASRTAVAFDLRRGGNVLTLEKHKITEEDVLLRDRQTQSTWSGLTGRCLEGPAKGQQLTQKLSTRFVVENWSLHCPKGVLYRRPKS
jgi:hypothetical protein